MVDYNEKMKLPLLIYHCNRVVPLSWEMGKHYLTMVILMCWQECQMTTSYWGSSCDGILFW